MTTRSKKTAEISPKSSITTKRIENSWIILAQDSLLKNSNFSIVTLPHPAHGTPSKYCIDDENRRVLELVTYDEPYRSWFIGETVKSDGSIIMMTPIHPAFLVLPRLKEQCSARAIPLEDLLAEKGFDKIFDCITSLDMIADMKGSADMKAYKYNEEKTIAWLETRVRKLAKVLRIKNVHVTPGALSSTYVASTINNDHIDEEFYLKYAHGMVSEYIDDDLSEKLEKKFNFQSQLIETIGKKRKSEVEMSNGTNKKIKSEDHEESFKEFESNGQSIADAKKQKPLTAKEKARQKAASGTKQISSFFAKK